MQQNKPEVSVVFHLDDTEKTGMTIKNILNLLADESLVITRLALVVNGEAIIGLVRTGEWEKEFLHLIQLKTAVYACRNAMKSKNINESDLIAGVISVPSGVGQLALLQTDHFAYIRP